MPLVSVRRSARLSILLWGVLFCVSSSRAADAPIATGQLEMIQLLPKTVAPPGTPVASTLFISPYLPAADKNTGAGVLILSRPSMFLSLVPDGEGDPLARWLNDHGIAAFLLCYRFGGEEVSADGPPGDVHYALQYLHAHAADFHLSANRIGVLGFGPEAAVVADAAFSNAPPPGPDSTDPIVRASAHPDFLALIYGASLPAAPATLPPATFLVGSTSASDNLSTMIDFWNYLRSPRIRVPIEAHFFPKTETNNGIVPEDPSLGVWPNLFYNWVRAYGFLTDQPRVALHGSVSLDGRPLPFGYVILTPLDSVGAGPIIARVFNSTAGVTIGTFSVPANQGPVPGRYHVDVRQNANRWLSNSFSADLIRDPAFGHARILSPSIDDQHSFTKVHPGDKDDLVLEIKPDGNADLNIAVFSQ